jgi:hypothetical protein
MRTRRAAREASGRLVREVASAGRRLALNIYRYVIVKVSTAFALPAVTLLAVW